MLTTPVNQEIQLTMPFPTPAKRAKLSQAITTTSTTPMQPVSLTSLPSTSMESTCLDSLRNRLDKHNKFTTQNKFLNKQVWVEALLAQCPVEELRRVEKNSIVTLFKEFAGKFPVSSITICNAFRAIIAKPDNEQTSWFKEYVTTQPFDEDNNEDTETRWVAKMLEKRKEEGGSFTAPILRHLMITIKGRLTSVCLQKCIRILEAEISPVDKNKAWEIFNNTVSVDPLWRLHDTMNHDEFPPTLRTEANMFCLFRGKEKEHGINRNIISGAVVLAHAELEPDSPLEQWFEGWYTQNKMTPACHPDTNTVALTLLNYVDLYPLPGMSKLTVGNLLIFLQRKGCMAKFESTEDAAKIFNICKDARLSAETEKRIIPIWEKYAAQPNITQECKMGKTMETSGIGKAVLARYMLKAKISFTIAILFTAQRVIDQEPLEIGTIDWLNSELKNITGYSSRKKTQWLKNILQKKDRPREITEILRGKLTEKLLRGIWQTKTGISYTTLDKLMQMLKRSLILSDIPPVELITDSEPASESVCEPPPTIPVPCAVKLLNEEEEYLYFLDELQSFAVVEPFVTLNTADIAIGRLAEWPFP